MHPVWQTGSAESSTPQKEGGGGRSTPLSDFDALTRLLSRSGFNAKVRQLIDANPEEAFVLIYGDIDRFKVYNDLFGTQAGDQLLASIGDMLRTYQPKGAVAARLRADHFVCFCPCNVFDPDRVLAQLDAWFAAYREDFTFFVRLGIYAIEQPDLEVNLMCDRALLALRASKEGHGGSKYTFYDETLRSSLLKEQELAGEMITALEQGQFVPFFQPQYRYITGHMVGAEVLARWNHPTKGLLSPAEFIPVFERNGLIAQLDFYMWEQACSCLRSWIDAFGAAHVPRLSVNLSRADIYRADLCSYLSDLVQRYDIPADMLHLEITETAYMEAPEQLIEAVVRLRSAGFVVEMDDFGSGYSSLNTLKDVPVDVLKIDMGFLDVHESSRGGIILASVVRMARWLDLPTIAEGVETELQAAYLSSVGCEYMQGYQFSPPVDRATFEGMIHPHDVERAAFPLLETVREDANDFWNAESQLALIFNDYVGAAAIAETNGKGLEIVRANHDFLQMLEVEENAAEGDKLRKNLLKLLVDEDRRVCKEALSSMAQGQDSAVCEFRYRTPGGTGRWLRIRMRVLSRAGDISTLFVLAEETTEEQALRDRMVATRETIPGGLAFYEVGERIRLLDFSDAAAELAGCTREEYFAWLCDDVLLSIYPDDQHIVQETIQELRDGQKRTSCTVRANIRTGGFLWVHVSASAVYRGDGAFYIVAVIIDVTKEKENERLLSEQNALQRRLYDAIPCGIVRYTVDDNPRIVSINTKGLALLGYRDLEEYRARAGVHALMPIHPDDLERHQAAIEHLKNGAPPIDFSYRYLRCDNSVGWLEGTSALEVGTDGRRLVQSAFIDVTDQHEKAHSRHERAWQNERYRLLSEMTNAISFDYDSESDTVLLYIDRTGKGMEAQVIPHYVETLDEARAGVLHPDSVQPVREMFESVRDGVREVGVEYQANYYGTGFGWYRANLYVVHDDAGTWHLVGLIENIDDERDLRYRAEYDGTTGLTNHAATQDLVTAALANPKVRAHSVCVVLDIDDFKRVNDSCGHIEGDALLHAVGQVLRTNFRESDIIGRVGGDEFVLLLKDIDLDVALRKLECVCAQVSALDVTSLDAAPSVSVGVYTTCLDDCAYRDVFVKADEALYQAKRAGKNRIQVHQA